MIGVITRELPSATVTEAGIEIVGGCGGALLTVTVTAAAVAVLPAASRARAASVCAPSATVVVSHKMLYGLVVFSALRFTPSSKNCTPATPILSLALADTVTVPETIAPLAGAIMATVGGVVSGGGGGGAVIVTCAVPDFVGSATLTAFTATVAGLGTEDGAVYKPEVEIFPRAMLPPEMSFTNQLTAVFDVFVTVGVNCCVFKTSTGAEAGETVTTICGGGGGGGGELLDPPQLDRTKKTPRTTKAEILFVAFIAYLPLPYWECSFYCVIV